MSHFLEVVFRNIQYDKNRTGEFVGSTSFYPELGAWPKEPEASNSWLAHYLYVATFDETSEFL